MPLDSDPRKHRISEITRRDIVDALLLDKTAQFHGKLDLISFLKRIWPLSSMPSTDNRFRDAEGDIWQHMVNNYDWDESELLYRRLQITDIPDERFAKFLETCVHPLVTSDKERINKLIALFNDALQNDGFSMRTSGEISGRPIYQVAGTTGGGGVGHEYEVVLSFAGEDREYVEGVAHILRASEVSLFYDNYEEASLWGKDLVEHLHKVYSGSARYCVMFISKHYAEKVWPTHERRSAFEKAIESKEEYILPARFDDTEIPGLRKTVSYVDLRHKSAEQFAAVILQKLGLRDSKQMHARPHVAIGPESDPPFAVEAIAIEDDTQMILSADPEFEFVEGSAIEAVRNATNAEPRQLGSVVVKPGRPKRFLAIVHDLSKDPTWSEGTIQEALGNVFREAEERRLTAIAVRLMGRRFGLQQERFMHLFDAALSGINLRSVQRVWVVLPV
jgi:hypothetical protein